MTRPSLLAYSTSGRLFDAGCEKLHVFDWTTGRVLCGRHLVGSCVAEVTQEWLDSTDGARLCRQCAQKAMKLLGET